MKKRSLIIIILSIILATALIIGGFFIFRAIRLGDESANMSDGEFLSSFSSWRKEGDETVTWSFNNDFTGTISTNEAESYTMIWSLSNDKILTIKTAWLYDMTDNFVIEINRNQKSFTVTSQADNTTSTFLATETTQAD